MSFSANEEKAAVVAKQWREALGDSTRVTCECGLCAPLRFLYRCLYCGQFYCQSCGEIHFGKTRAEYNAEKASAALQPSTQEVSK